MRTFWDRMRHAVLFEIVGLILVILLSGWVFDTHPLQFGVLALFLSLTATAWNYVFNLAFDHALLKLGKSLYKTLWQRVIHAIIFEAGMLAVTLPLVVWWLSYGWLEALNMSIALMIFYLIYTYVYNIAYDHIFPIPGEQ